MTTITMSYPAFLACCLAFALLVAGLMVLAARLTILANREADSDTPAGDADLDDADDCGSPFLSALWVYFALTTLMGVVSALIG